jgi:hypothetical protein
MKRNDLQTLARLRVREARTLLRAHQYEGAYYLMGYSVECALKACVAKQVNRYDFPSKELATRVYTHDIEQLFKLSGLWMEFQKEISKNRWLEVNWAVVKDWSASSRYDVAITMAQAKDLYSACVSRPNGVLSWIKIGW